MLTSYGWSDALQHDFAPFAAQGLAPARVLVQQRGRYRLITEAGELAAECAGRLLADAPAGGLPVAGDWVAAVLRPQEGAATIRHVLARRTAFVRKAAQVEAPQVVAANIDVAFLACGLDEDFNLRRLERYLAAAWESGARPVVLLTKADLCADLPARIAEAEQVAIGAEVLALSAATGEGLEAVRAHLAPGVTAALLGMSGVGKSTLVNALAGEDRLATGAVREGDARGRHTTTHRELVPLPGGGLLLDTPGMRELGLWGAGEGVSHAFAEIEALAADCRFRDCHHEREPGCAVQAALASGDLPEARWRSYRKLQREQAHLDRKDDPLAQQAERKRWIAVHKHLRQRQRLERGE
ncbi:MAG: ribosome small subunit-dependent GTPase A [Phenylobacterium sp.]